MLATKALKSSKLSPKWQTRSLWVLQAAPREVLLWVLHCAWQGFHQNWELMFQAGNKRHLHLSCVTLPGPFAGSKHTERATITLVGMGEKLLLNSVVFLGRQSLPLGSFQIITAAFEGSSRFRGNQAQQKSDGARPLVCVWPEKG